MKRIGIGVGVCLLGLFWAVTGSAQQPLPAEESVVVAPREVPGASVPRLIKFSGVVKDTVGKPRTGTLGITFALYADPEGGAPLWLETQNVALDDQGRYSVLLGAASREGLPLQLFASNQAHWLAVQVAGEPEQPRLLLVSVPYALKAEEAERLAGKEASAFVQVEGLEKQMQKQAQTLVREELGKQTETPRRKGTKNIDTGASTFTANNATQVVNMTQQGSGLGLRAVAPVASAILGLNTAPSGGVAGLRGESQSPDGVGIFGRATSTSGVNTGVRGESLGSTGRGIVGTALSATGATIGIRGVAFSPSGTGISALVDSNTGTTTGLDAEVRSVDGTAAIFRNINDGKLLSGVGGGGEVFSVSGSGTLALSGNLELPNTASASVGVLTKGGARFLHNFGTSNTFVGENAGNTSLTGINNSAFGRNALQANTSGPQNSAFGAFALEANSGGPQNSAFGAFALRANTAGSNNAAFGVEALRFNTIGGNNSAFGSDALAANTAGSSNSAFGRVALTNNTASDNSAFGSSALTANTTGDSNSAFGRLALLANTIGNNNSAFGFTALIASTVGNGNSAFGTAALTNLSSGSGNIALGSGAGADLGVGSSNIYIGNSGASAESNTIRIGAGQTTTFLAGIRGVTTGINDAIPVLIDSAGQLGTISSTRRVKEDIRDMGGASAGLLRLRPVVFRYRQAMADGSKPLQYGLIAEEVAEVMPELVVYDAEGQPQTVQYHVLPALLLNELQRQQTELQRQQDELAQLRALLRAQAAELAELKAALRATLAARQAGAAGPPDGTR